MVGSRLDDRVGLEVVGNQLGHILLVLAHDLTRVKHGKVAPTGRAVGIGRYLVKLVGGHWAPVVCQLYDALAHRFGDIERVVQAWYMS